jgi:MFS family permease
MNVVLRPRLAVSVVFLAHGLGTGTWVSRIPAVQEDLGLSVGALGFTLLGGGLGSLLALLPSGAIIGRFGSRRVSLVTSIAACASLSIMGLVSTNAINLFLALVLWGATAGALDVGMNAQGSTIEQRRPTPIMSSLHGLWSVGSMAGAAFGAVLAGLDISFRTHFIVAGPLLGVLAFLACRAFISGDHSEPGERHWPRGDVLALAAIVFCAVAVEGAMFDWGGVYLRRVLEAPEATAAAAASFFSVAMAIGRLSGDYLSHRFGAALLARICAVVAGVGVVTIIVAPVALVVFAGLVATGFGLSVLVPLAFGAAGRAKAMPTGAAIATVATVGYSVFLIGPPTIGLLAEQFGLRGAFLVLPALLALILVLAPAMHDT